MRRGHDLSAAPSLVETDIADEVTGLHAAVGTVARELSAATANRAGEAARRHRAETGNAGLDTGYATNSAPALLMICVVRRASVESVADKPLPSWAV